MPEAQVHHSPTDFADLTTAANQALEIAKQLGAQEADVLVQRCEDFTVQVADGKIITLSQATSQEMGLRLFVNKRLGFCATSDFKPQALAIAVQKALSMAKLALVDNNNGLPNQHVQSTHLPDFDVFDPAVVELSVEQKISWAHTLEQAARAVDPRIRKFRDSGVSTRVSYEVLMNSQGLLQTLPRTQISVWSTPVACEGHELQTEAWYDTKTHLQALEPLESIGRTAGQRALRMLGARPIATQQVPIIFEPAMAASLIGSLLPALDGNMVYKQASFLASKLHESIACSQLNVFDDPHLVQGCASTPYDGEGLATHRKKLIDAGRLTTFFYDTYTARKAGLSPTANGQRHARGLPHGGAFQTYIAAGKDSVDHMYQSVPCALLVTRGLGHGLNTVTGEYSRGVNGLWIERGEVVHAVAEVTLAADFVTMLKQIDCIGDNLHMRGNIGAPSLRISSMMVSGS